MRDMREFAEFGEGLRERGGFGTARFGAQGRITASSSRTMAGSSTNMESGRAGSGGREST